jgi:hypothetical protein
MSLTVVVSLNSFAESIHRLQQAEERLSALGEARSLVARASGGEALSTGTISGKSPSGRKWTLTVEEEKSLKASGGVRLLRISVAVKSEDEKAMLVMLRTMTAASIRPE